MKKNCFFIAAAVLTLASCASDEVIEGGTGAINPMSTNEIAFAAGSQANTRATLSGKDAADKLGNKFVVYGTKHATAEDGTAGNDAVVFNQYQVEYAANTAGTSLTNTHNWEYVGKTAYAAATTSQTPKYWDYSAAQGYTFYAFSSSQISYPAAGTDLVSVEKLTTGTNVYGKGYKITTKPGADLDKMFYADRKPVALADYGKPVTLTFRSFGSRVRVGFYETVPGYTVKIKNFYAAPAPSAVVTKFKDMSDAKTDGFYASLQNVKTAAPSNVFSVVYNSDAAAENQVKVTNTTATYDYTLKLGNGVIDGNVLKTSSTDPTWDQASGAYTTVYPFEENTNPMLIRVDYTLTAEDGSNEVIEVKNARVVVPTQYVQWKSNYAYTYLFKISNNTNGTTGNIGDGGGGSDPNPDQPVDPNNPSTTEGLFPITFDAVVVDATDFSQETVSTFANNSITSYANGSEVTANGEYKSGETINVSISDISTHSVIKPTAIGTAAQNAQVYLVTTTGETISEASVKGKLTGLNNGITLTPVTPAASIQTEVTLSDNTKKALDNVQFVPGSAGSYAYVYTTTAYVAPTYAPVGAATYSDATTYYRVTTGGVYYAASGITADNFDTYKTELHTKTAAGTAGQYDVKVITVK